MTEDPNDPFLLTPDFDLRFEHDVTADAYGYWRSRRGDALMPRRADIDPVDMRGFLSHVALVDVLTSTGEQPKYRVRLAGTRIEQVAGPLTEKFLYECFPPPIERRWKTAFRKVVETRRPCRFTGRVAIRGQGWLKMECTLAPLGEDGQTVSQLFGAVHTWAAG